MPQQSEQQFSGLLGGPIEAAFGSNEPPKPIYRDEAIRNLERNLTSDVNIARSGLNNVLAQFRNRQRQNNPLLRSAALESDAALSAAINRQSPLQDLIGVGDYLSGLFQKQVAPYIDPIARNIYNQTTIGNLARGIGGTPAGSSYSDLLRGRILGQTAADYGSRMMGMLPSLFPALQSANQSRLSELMNIFPARRTAFESLEARAMNPYMARLAGLRDLQGLAMGQNALNIGNLQGYQPRENWANRVGAVGRSIGTNVSQLLDWAQQAASIYGSVMGGGMGGMMGGGGGGSGLGSLFGGGGSPGSAARANQSADMLNAYPRSYTGDVPTGFQPYA